MKAQRKRYNVVIHGRVQDIGLRNLIAQMANFLGLRGYVFNDVDGSVRIIVEGTKNTLDSFLDDIRIKTGRIGAEIESLDRREVSLDIDLPPRFVKIPTTELEEIGRKLDIGIGKLSSIDGKLDKLNILVDGQNEMRVDQKKGLDTQEKMLKVLEKIASKI
ncbi:acylphosphatase [Candidatus Pyrohabitans sp.]